MKKKILIGLAILAALVLVFLIVVMLQPSRMYIERSVLVNAPPAEVFPHVNNLQEWEEWSPWAKLDPNVDNSYEGPLTGEGAKHHWDGNEDVGAGTLTITTSKPHELIVLDLLFIRPFEDRAKVEFLFEPQGEETKVTWTMEGNNNFTAKLMSLFIDFEEMIGKDYETGLANLKRVAEA